MFSQNSNKGVTVIELVIATLITSIILTSTIALVVANRRLQNVDAVRTSSNQTLRSAMEIIGTDIQLAGQRLSSQGVRLPAIRLENGNSLTLRNSLVDSNLSLCQDTIGANGTNIHVATDQTWITAYASANDGGDPDVNAQIQDQLKSCLELDGDTNGEDDRVELWEAYRIANGGSVKGYVSDQLGNVAEFFTYVGETYPGASNNLASIQVGSSSFANTYPILNNISLYLLESRQYILIGDELQLIIDDDTANPLTIVKNIDSFSIKAIMDDGSELTNLGLSSANPSDPQWTSVVSFEISIAATVSEGGSTATRTLTSNFFARNALSNPN